MIHRDENNFPEPEMFNPDRFSSETIQERKPFDYIPFSAGKRNCIGQRFALMEEKIILVHILRKFKIKSMRTTKEIHPIADLLLRAENPVLINFEERKFQ